MIEAVQPASAGRRIAPVPVDTDDPVVAPVFRSILAKGNQPLGIHRTIANAPKLFRSMFDFAMALRFDTALPGQDRELAILLACHLASGDYQFDKHVPMAVATGLTMEQANGVRVWRDTALFNERQQAVLEFCRGMIEGQVSDAVFDRLAGFLGQREIVELAVCAAYYHASSLSARALGVSVDDD